MPCQAALPAYGRSFSGLRTTQMFLIRSSAVSATAVACYAGAAGRTIWVVGAQKVVPEEVIGF